MNGRPDICTTRKDLTLTGAAGAHADDLFVVAGPVEILAIYGIVRVILADNLTLARLDLDDGAAPVDLTLAAGPAISLLPPLSYIGRSGAAGVALRTASSAAPAIYDCAPDSWVHAPVHCVPNSQVPTTIRFHHTSAAATGGTIRWTVEYRHEGAGGISAA